jgi:regulator of cell morphogenesis and NO signaling
MSIDPSRTVAELVLEQPSRTRVFEELGLDYCCGGQRSLTSACARRSIDVAAALVALEATDDRGAVEAEDWSAAPLEALCDHIVEVHHGRLRTELPRLSGLLAKVERAHGTERPELVSLRTTFEGMRSEIEEHMTDEEARLFPACRAGIAFEPEIVDELGKEHDATGAALEQMHELAQGYDLASALCNTHRATLDGLRELELDLHQHIHEENNILFPRALAGAA